MISFNNVSFGYPDAPPVLNNVSFTIPKGQFVSILGANGSGKTTLAKLINVLLLPSKGTITVEGLTTTDPNNIFPIRSKVGFVFQHPDNQIVASVVENEVAFGPENLGITNPDLQALVSHSLSLVGLAGFEKRETASLSGGQKQRLALAGALAMQPSILILDEASAMLDPQGKQSFMQLCKELHKQGLTIILITHNMQQAAQAQRVLVLHQGALVLDGPSETIFTHDKTLKNFNLDYPFPVQFSWLLQDRGIDIPTYGEEEPLKEALCNLYSKM